jgi:plastin-1
VSTGWCVADQRLSINQTLASISKDGRGVTDMEIVKWANEKVKSSGKTSTMRSFKDPSLSNAVFFLDLLNAVRPGIVDYALIAKGSDAEEKKMNGESQIVPGLMISQTGDLHCEKDGSSDLLGPRG